MKKNLFWSMLAMSGMLFATSCSQDELINESNGDFVNATFNIGAADLMGSRAIGEGDFIDEVACAVYDAKDNEMTELRQYKEVNGGKATYSIRLAKGQAYRVAFFAYDKEANAYDVTNMKNIKINEGQLSNIDNRDAFTNYINITAEETMNTISKPVTLYRPFAQINMGIDNDELADARKAGVVITNTKVVINNVYKAFNAFDNAVVESTLGSMTFELNGLPNQKLLNVNGQEYNYLAMNYVLVGNKGVEKGLTDIEFIWTTADGKTNNPTTHFTNIPAQRNYRTNIIGRLITNPADFNITIEAGFAGDKNENGVVVSKEVNNAAELQAAIDEAEAGQNIIKLNANISTQELIIIEQKKDVEIYIDGNGKTVDAKFTIDGKNKLNGTEGATFKNVKFIYSGNAEEIVHIGVGSGNSYAHNVIFEDCYFRGNAPANMAKTTGVRAYQSKDLKFLNCTATMLHSFALLYSCNDIIVDKLNSNCMRGMSLDAGKCIVTNSTIEATKEGAYGIRKDICAASGDYLKIENSTVKAEFPVVVRNTSHKCKNITDFIVEFIGNNTLTKAATTQYEVAIAEEEYEGQNPEDLTKIANATVIGAGEWSIFK